MAPRIVCISHLLLAAMSMLLFFCRKAKGGNELCNVWVNEGDVLLFTHFPIFSSQGHESEMVFRDGQGENQDGGKFG